VNALEKATGKSNKITITNDKGRLSKSEIEKMVQDAELHRQEDERQKKRIEAKNALENYCYSIRNTIKDEKFQGKLSQSEKDQLESMCSDTLKWVESNANAEPDDFEQKQKEIEAVFNPIVTKLYQSEGGSSAGAQGGAGDMPGDYGRRGTAAGDYPGASQARADDVD